MEDGIINQFQYWAGPDDEVEAKWAGFKAEYMTKPKAARIHELQMVDTWLDQQTSLTREHASLVTRKRELFDLHTRLLQLGR
jgi:hypothetical protein